IVVAPLGATDNTPSPAVSCAMTNWNVVWPPAARSVARSNPICVGVLGGTAMTTRASPFASDTTVCVCASGEAGFVVWSENWPCTTSKRTERPAKPEPVGPVTRSETTLVCPEQTSPVLHGVEFGTMVIEPGSRTAGRTETVAVSVTPAASRIVTIAVSFAPTLFARSASVLPLTFCGTGNADGFDENAWYGGVPPEIE